jgi:energy-converting hydrogenase A subunit K
MLLWNYIDDIYRSGSMNSEDVIVYFTALVAIGMIVVGLLTTALHSYLIAPIVIIGVILAIFVLLAKGNFAHKIESIEKLCFIITFLAIICSFILLYKPM